MTKLALPALLFTFLAMSTLSCSGKAPKPAEPALGATPPTESWQEIPLAGAFKVHRTQLANGLRLLVVEDHSSPTLAYQTWFRVGSRDEVPNYTGLAHLFEHMMFKGTKNLKEGQFDRLLEESGAEGENAFTNNDYTAYIQEMPKDKLELVARLEADRMVNLVVNDESFKTEREVVQNERRFRVENNPDGLMWQTLGETAFTKHPYHWPVIGYQEDLNRMNASDAAAFYKSFYSPNHATVIIAGDVTPDEALKVAKKYYGGLASAEAPARQIEAEPPQISPRRKQLKLAIQVEKLMMAYHIPAATHEDIPALNMLQAVLGSGKSSRLHRALVETGICSNIDVGSSEDKDPSIFMISCNLQEKRKATQAEAITLNEIARMIKQPVSAPELERARNKVAFGYFEGLDSNYKRAHFLGRYEVVGPGFELGLKIRDAMGKVTPEQIQAVATKYLDPKTRTVITGVKK